MVLGQILGILAYLLPAIVLYLALRYGMQAYLNNEEKKRLAARQSAYDESLLPLKLQACERLILLLERITPAQAVNRALQPGMTAYEFQMTLLKNIREEFEHNVAQQLYISPACWSLIRTAKEQVIHMVNISASETPSDSTAANMARLLIENWSTLDQNPVQSAIDQLKNEILFNAKC